MNGNFAGRLFTGLVIIAVGVGFLLRQLGIVTISIGELFSTYWPVFPILLGLSKLIGNRFRDGSGLWGAIVLFVGIVFLGNNLGWMTWTIGDVVPYAIPFIIIIVGLRMILKPQTRKSYHQTPPTDEWKSYRPYDSNVEVPPAPPLHPDPTKRTADSNTDADSSSNEYQEQESRKEPDYSYEEEPRERRERHSRHHREWRNESSHSYRERGHRSWGHHGGREHVEWWNHDANVQSRSGFIGDIHMGHDYWELKPLNISHFIGDTVLDLTKAQIPYGETKICISSFIGDVKVYVPNDYEIGIQVVSSAFIGDVKVLGQKEGGLFTSVNTKSPMFSEADKKIKLVVSTFIGDTRVTKVG
ncbi:cell wall-active antibiotics response protein LiaF [Paenibacillus sp. HB172176]|uniref:cell wall-active antibiotics response protein LiaF n=1 Tax=Paenibacillus sp. HB172176 TaxID=2493690 RepID=UPI0014393233|nr:cell wall-active antibiotics response protein LiaF [Paenibacillus sp. HB172176]